MMKLFSIFLLTMMFSAVSYGEGTQKNDDATAQKSDSEVAQKYDEDVKDFMKEKIIEICRELNAYHYVKDKISEKPIEEYADYFDETKFKTFSPGIQERIRQVKLFTMFAAKDFTDVDEVNKTIKGFLTLRSKLMTDDEKAKDLLTRKRSLGKLSGAKCKKELDTIDEKTSRKLHDAYWKIIKKYFKKYKL